jgi:hypothetical protein
MSQASFQMKATKPLNAFGWRKQFLSFFGTDRMSHTLIHTFAVLDYPPHFVPGLLRVKCELRDVICILQFPF